MVLDNFGFMYIYIFIYKIVCNVGLSNGKLDRWNENKSDESSLDHPWCIRHSRICAISACLRPMRIDRVLGVIGRIVSRPCDAVRSVDNGYRHGATSKIYILINPLYSFKILSTSPIERESERSDGTRTTECYLFNLKVIMFV